MRDQSAPIHCEHLTVADSARSWRPSNQPLVPGKLGGFIGTGIPAETNSLTAQMMTSGCLETAFIAATLLTGSVTQAETAVLEGIRSLNVNARPDQELLRTTVAAALDPRQRYRCQPREEVSQASSLLPVALQRVLQLPTDLRQCLVLRFLMTMPREFSARLLGINAGKVDRNAGLAAQALAQIAQAEKTDEQTHAR
jgi:hypothetical protein